MIKLFVCAADPVAGLWSFLADSKEIALIGQASTISAAIRSIREMRPDVLLFEHSTATLSELAFLSASVACVLWTRNLPEAELIRAFRAGAKGAVRKSSPLKVVLEALRRVKAGEIFLEKSVSSTLRQWTISRNLLKLTARERHVIDLVSRGLRNREIAARLTITPATVKSHLMHVFAKLDFPHS